MGRPYGLKGDLMTLSHGAIDEACPVSERWHGKQRCCKQGNSERQLGPKGERAPVEGSSIRMSPRCQQVSPGLSPSLPLFHFPCDVGDEDVATTSGCACGCCWTCKRLSLRITSARRGWSREWMFGKVAPLKWFIGFCEAHRFLHSFIRLLF